VTIIISGCEWLFIPIIHQSEYWIQWGRHSCLPFILAYQWQAGMPAPPIKNHCSIYAVKLASGRWLISVYPRISIENRNAALKFFITRHYPT
jgi:hypothetical protein